MTYSVLRMAKLMTAIVLLLTACSGGESGTGIGGQPKVSVGTITGFGSVFVNGIEFDTSAASIYVNDSPATEQDLSTGMVVAVVGSTDTSQATGEARAVYYENEVRGIVVHNKQPGTLEIMGQTVNYDADTLFDSVVATVKTIVDIPVNAVVEVSGYRIGDNALQATHISLLATDYSLAGQITVKGVVESVSGNRFTMGNLTVLTDTSTQYGDHIPNQTLTVGMNIKVKSQRGLLNGELQADNIRLNKREYAATGASVEVEGIMMNLDAQAGEFRLNGYTVYYSEQTEIQGGAVPTDGLKAQVDGVLISESQLEAKQVTFRYKNNTHLIARVSNVDGGKNQVTVLGVTLQITNDTVMKDDDLNIKKFSLLDVNAGDKIEIKAYKSDNTNVITASQFIRIKADSTDTAVEVKGILEQYASDRIVVSGIAVDMSSLSSAPGISAADIGRSITVKGTAADNGTEIIATDVST